MRVSIVLILLFFIHCTGAKAEEMIVKIVPNPSVKSRSASVEKINVFAKKQAQAIDLEAFSIHVDRIHQIEQIYSGGAIISNYVNDGNFKVSIVQLVTLKAPQTFIYHSHLKCLYPKHTFW